MMAKDPIPTAKKLALVAVAMFGFGYAMVPLYDVFCDITGLNGKTGEISQSKADTGVVDFDRLVKVQFDTNVHAELSWNFKPLEYEMKVHPGKITEAIFVAENLTDKPIVGRAVPSVAPTKASLFFNKTECFCFTEQVLQPGERKEMPVRFVVDSDLPQKIKTMTLSYTFFEATGNEDVEVTDKSVTKATHSKG